MTQITDTDFTQPAIPITILNKGLHGGFINENSLSDEEITYCEQTEWIQRVYKYKCNYCGNWHTSPPGEERCLRTQQHLNPQNPKQGFRIIADSHIDLDTHTDYNLFVKESPSSVDTSGLPYKSIVFIPGVDNMVFPDRAGSTVFLPINELQSFVDKESRRDLVTDINEKRKRLVDWGRLDDNGDDFEEIIFRLVKRDENYFNENWGGTGPDQGKDGFCSVDVGGRPTRVMVQAKFNNQGSSINDRQVERSCRKASDRHDCRGLILAAIKTSGDLESEFYKGAFHSRSISYFRLWSGPKIKEKLAEHPDLISEMFLE